MANFINRNSDLKKTVAKSAKVIVLTTVMFTFISYWRAAAVVIGDLGSTAYYIGGITEQFIGKIAPYFILIVMLFSYAVRSLYMESSPLFTRGGVYRVVKFALGPTFAKFSVSALVFDYALTGPISSVSAGQYISGLLNDTFRALGWDIPIDRNLFSMSFAILVVIYFWWENVKGIEESSDKALKIFVVFCIMGALVLVWGLVTLFIRPEPILKSLPPFDLHLSDESYGWLKDIPWLRTVTFASIIIAFGHSLLALSGEETLGQVYREVEYPKLHNFKKTGVIIFIVSLLVTSGVSFYAVMLIPDNVRPQYIDNLIGGVAMYVAGPGWLKLGLQTFVVIVGAMILSAAVNTAIVGSNSVLNRVAEDKVIPDWFRKPHRKYGTTYRLLSSIAILQIATILLSQGHILILGEAYAFGVIWSLVFKSFAMIVLRYRDKRPREWKVPLNFHIGGIEIPVGLIFIFLLIFTTAVANLLTKPIATTAGLTFAFTFFIIFMISERINKKSIMTKRDLTEEEYLTEKNKRVLEHFNIEDEIEIDPKSIGLEKPECVMVAVRDPNNLYHLQKILHETDTETTDIVVMIGRLITDRYTSMADYELKSDEQELFSAVVDIAEKIGKSVHTIVIPTNNAFYAIMNTAYSIGAREVFLGKSEKINPDIQLEQLALLWGTLNSDESRHVIIRIITANKEFKVEL